MRILLTGGAGFIGHHIVEHLLKTTAHSIVLLDRLDVSGNLNRIGDVLLQFTANVGSRLVWVYHDFKAPISEMVAKRIGDIDLVLHIGASTHVDRSITDPMSFVMDNVVGTANVLDYIRVYQPSATMIYFSTDEVFGPANEHTSYTENARYNSRNPYAATKAGGEELCIAYANTYGLDIRVTHCMNVFGERQHKEKFIPLVVKNVLKGETVFIHADKLKQKAGSRFYIHARNVADAVMFVNINGVKGEKYNIVGALEVDNLTLAIEIAKYLGQPLRYELIDFHSSRPGHDLRYALDGRKMEQMGWKAPVDFWASLEKTVHWTADHQEWL